MSTGPTLETERLLLRRWRQADRAPFAAMNSDPVVMEFFPAMLDPDRSDAFAARADSAFDADGYGLWAVEVKGGEPFIGFVGIHSLAAEEFPFVAEAEVGWRLAASAWGRGFAPEGARAALGFGFDECGLGEIVSFTSVVNERSQRVMQKIGMYRDPVDDFDHPRVAEGHLLRPHVMYRLTAEQWRS
ncbi:MAG: GNAT family N-acetyltransferase [Acidimicrobiales bacterium]